MTTAEELSARMLDGVPLARAMGAHVASLSDGCAVVHAPLEPNRNVHGAAFAGSLYSLASLAGWLAVSWRLHGELEQAPASLHIVLADASVRYRRPSTGPWLVITAVADAVHKDEAAEALRTAGKLAVAVRVECRDADVGEQGAVVLRDAAGGPRAVVEARYVAKLVYSPL